MISIIIVNYNTAAILRDCLFSLYANLKRSDFEVIVADNFSSDGSVEMIKSEFPDVRIVANRENFGFAKANNQAIPFAKGEYIFLLNPDTFVLDGNIAMLADFMGSHPEAGACGPRVLNSDRTMQRQCKRGGPTFKNLFFYYSGLWRLFPGSPKWKKIAGGYFLLDKSDDAVCEVDQLSGAAMLIRKAAMGNVGPIEEKYVMYWEDTDYCFRLKAAGWKIYYVPGASIVHLGGAGGTQRHAGKNLWYFHRGAAMFYGRYLSDREPLAGRALFYAGNWAVFFMKFTANLLLKEKIIGSRKPAKPQSSKK